MAPPGPTSVSLGGDQRAPAAAAVTVGSGMTDEHAASAAAIGASRRSPTASVVRGAMALLSTQPLTWAASLLAASLVPRYLGDGGLGQYAVAVSVASFVATLTSLGVPEYLVRRVATQPARVAVDGGAAAILLVGLALLAGLAVSGGAFLLGVSMSGVVLWIALAGVIVGAPGAVLSSMLIGQERHARFAWFNAMATAAGVCAGVVVLAAGGSVAAYVGTTATLAGLAALLGWYAAGFRIPRASFDPRLFGQLARGGWPFLGWKVVLQIYGSVDQLLLVGLSREAVLGWYVAAYRIISIPMFLPTLIVTPLIPALSRCADDPPVFHRTLQRSLVAVLVLTVPISAMTIAVAPAIPALFGWPETFHHSVPLMMILALHQPFVGVDTLLGTALMALHKERRWLCVAIVAAVVNPALNVPLIPLFERWTGNGAIAAAGITVATELLMLAGALIVAPRPLIDRTTVSVAARVTLAGVCLVVVAAPLRPVWLPLAVVAGGAAYVVTALLLRIVRLSDVRMVRRTVLQMLARRTAGAAG